MLARIQSALDVSRTEASDATVGFGFLLVTIAGHVMVETARDALFLTDLPAARLPWAYLSIAVLALGCTAASRALAVRFPRGRILSWTSLLGAVVTAGFWWLCDRPRPEVVFVLYVWAGLLATALTVQFWVALGDRLGPSTARRTLAFVALGGLLGGVAGSLAATGLVAVTGPRSLLLCGALVFAMAAAIPLRLSPLPPATAASLRRQLARRPTRRALGDRYVRALLTVAVLTAVATTGIDFLFKSVVQSRVPAESLGGFFARFYVVVNALAFVTQLLATRPLLRLFGPGRTAAALPSIGTLAAALSGVAAGVVPAAMLKGADSVLRHSLHRTSTEILFVPLRSAARDPARALAGSLGQRGGQAVGSLLILGALALALDATRVSVALCVLCVLWVLAVRRVRRLYLERVAESPGPARPGDGANDAGTAAGVDSERVRASGPAR